MAASSSSSSRMQNIHPTLEKIAPFIFTSNIQWPEELNTALIDISNVLFSGENSSLEKNQIDQLKRALEIIKRYVSECSDILYKPNEVCLKSTIYLSILSTLDCHFQRTKQELKAERKAFRKALKSKEEEENIKEEKQSLETEERDLKSWEKDLQLKEETLIADKKAFIKAFLEELIKLQQYTAELKRKQLWELGLSILKGISVPAVINDAAIFVSGDKEPWLVSDPHKLSDQLCLWDAFNIIATVKSRLQQDKLYDNYVFELNTAIGIIQAYRRYITENRKELAVEIPICQEAENYAEKLRGALFRLREITQEVPNPRRSAVSSNASERGPSFFESKQEVESGESSNLGKTQIDASLNSHHLEKPIVSADLTVQLLRENEQKKESRIGKFIRKHPVKAAAIAIFGCLTLLCVGVGIGLLSGGIGIGIAGILAAGISLLSVGPVYPIVLGGTYCLYKSYYNYLKKQSLDNDGALFKHSPS